jgi:hypothetical protein
MPKGPARRPLRERFEAFVHQEPNRGCHLWGGSLTTGGYGQVGRGGKHGGKIDAHRAAWTLYRGEVPGGLHVLHSCDVRSCVNPDHLWLGTDQDNHADMARKGRGTRSKSGLPYGVYPHQGKFSARIQNKGKSVHLGAFGTIEEAAMAAASAKAALLGTPREMQA